ncbi:MAG: AtpZ/AtpI family protein [Pseudomonadota bacterium]
MGDDRKKSSPERLEKLGDRLTKAQVSVDERNRPRQRQPNALGFAFRITTELVAAVAVGVAIGWGLDKWLDSKPWFLIMFFFLGVAAGVMNVYRITQSTGGDGDIPKSRLPSVKDDDDD